jgi:hypothetical protein
MPRHFLPLAGAGLKNRAAGAFCLRPLSCCISFGNWRSGGRSLWKKALAVPALSLSLRRLSALPKHQKKLIGRGAHLAVPLIGQRDCA